MKKEELTHANLSGLFFRWCSWPTGWTRIGSFSGTVYAFIQFYFDTSKIEYTKENRKKKKKIERQNEKERKKKDGKKYFLVAFFVSSFKNILRIYRKKKGIYYIQIRNQSKEFNQKCGKSSQIKLVRKLINEQK